jgi:hypothetical protein
LWPGTVGDLQAIDAALMLAACAAVEGPPVSADLRGEMDQFAAGMVLLWGLEASAGACPLLGFVLLVVAACTSQAPQSLPGLKCPHDWESEADRGTLGSRVTMHGPAQLDAAAQSGSF